MGVGAHPVRSPKRFWLFSRFSPVFSVALLKNGRKELFSRCSGFFSSRDRRVIRLVYRSISSCSPSCFGRPSVFCPPHGFSNRPGAPLSPTTSAFCFQQP